MADVDTDGDGYMSYQEFQDSWDSDPENPELDYDEVTILFDDCDYDDNDLIDIDEMQCFVDGIVDMLPDGGDENPEQMFGLYRHGRRRLCEPPRTSSISATMTGRRTIRNL